MQGFPTMNVACSKDPRIQDSTLCHDKIYKRIGGGVLRRTSKRKNVYCKRFAFQASSVKNN